MHYLQVVKLIIYPFDSQLKVNNLHSNRLQNHPDTAFNIKLVEDRFSISINGSWTNTHLVGNLEICQIATSQFNEVFFSNGNLAPEDKFTLFFFRNTP